MPSDPSSCDNFPGDSHKVWGISLHHTPDFVRIVRPFSKGEVFRAPKRRGVNYVMPIKKKEQKKGEYDTTFPRSFCTRTIWETFTWGPTVSGVHLPPRPPRPLRADARLAQPRLRPARPPPPYHPAKIRNGRGGGQAAPSLRLCGEVGGEPFSPNGQRARSVSSISLLSSPRGGRGK